MRKLPPHEFFVILSPTRAITDYVTFLKGIVKHALGHTFEGERSTAHISLFKYKDVHNESLLYHIEDRVSGFAPFHIHIKNLGIFEHGENKTIYLEIVNKNPICDLAEALIGHRINPHITIAKNLDAKDFAIAWRTLKDLSYSDYFKCDRITVLKKHTHRWNKHLEFPLYMGVN
jgi:2'-5' RNA ligase